VPIRLWQEGVFLFAASSPCDPDLRLGLLPQAEGNWQWLPLCGADFPLQTYAQRGPLVAWTPRLSDVAVKLESKSAEAPAAPARHRGPSAAALAVLLVLLLGANLWALWTLPGRLSAGRPAPGPDRPPDSGAKPAPVVKSADGEAEREKFALALHRLLSAESRHSGELSRDERQLVERYRRLVKIDGDLRVDGPRAQATVGLLSALAHLSPERVAQVVQDELSSQEVAKTLTDRVRDRLLAEGRKRP
jgi:hypothetical protein